MEGAKKRKRGFILTDLPVVVLKTVFSFLTFAERQQTRLVCQSQKKFVDEHAPGADALFVSVAIESSHLGGYEWEYEYNMKLDRREYGDENRKKDFVILFIHIWLEYRFFDDGNSTIPDLVRSLFYRLPKLDFIRPKKLEIYLREKGYAQAFYQLMRYLNSEKMSDTVTTVKLDLNGSFCNRYGVRQTCSLFNQVKRLELMDARHLVFACFFPGLEDLKIIVSDDRKPDDECRYALAKIQKSKTLRKICVADDRFRVSGPTKLVSCMGSLANLEELKHRFWCGSEDIKQVMQQTEQLASLSRGMSNLQSLRTLENPTNKFWDQLRERRASFNSIIRLDIRFRVKDSLGEQLSTTVAALPVCFPALFTLYLDFQHSWNTVVPVLRPYLLAGLKRHRTLKRVVLLGDDVFWTDDLERRLEPKIKVEGTPLRALSDPSSEFWNVLQEQNMPFNGFVEFEFRFNLFRAESHLKAMVQALPVCFPNLKLLCLDFQNPPLYPRAYSSDLISGLKQHERLSTVVFSGVSVLWTEDPEQFLGPKIKVVRKCAPSKLTADEMAGALAAARKADEFAINLALETGIDSRGPPAFPRLSWGTPCIDRRAARGGQS